MAQYFLLKIAQAQLLAFSFQQQLKLFDIWVWLLCTIKSCDGLLTSIFSRGLETQLIRPLPQSSWRMAAETTRMKRWRRAWWRGVVGISRISCNLYLEICSMSSNRVTMNGSIHWSLASNIAIQPTKHALISMHIQRIDSPHDDQIYPGSAAGAKACTRPGARRISGGDPQQLKRRPGVSGDAGPTGAATAVPRISARVWTMRLLGSKSKRSKILPTLQPLASLYSYWFNVVEFEFAIVDQVKHRCIIRLSFGIEFVFSKVLLFQQRVFFLKSNPETDPSAVEVCAQV